MDNSNQTQELKQSLVQYQDQLNQIELALSVSKSGPEYDSLLGLKNDIKELIFLTNENLSSLLEQNSCSASQSAVLKPSDYKEEDPFEKEYALFKAEIQKEENGGSQFCKDEDSQESVTVDIKNELAALQGSKCQAPFRHKWEEGDNCAYHNALVMSVEDIDAPANNIQDILVRVMFVNPVHKKMVPCPYYLEGDCKFPDDKCHYSHGELIPFADLKEYKEPDFSSIKVGSRVLAKYKDNLWHHASVLELISDDIIKVKFNMTAGGTIDIDLHEILPLDNNNSTGSSLVNNDDEHNSVLVRSKNVDESCDIDGDSDKEDRGNNSNRDAVIQLSLLRTPTSSAIGDWEKHTKGIGSRLMASMGYIVGSGLGPRGEGRLEPVEALIFPPGKSLDHCMALRESAGGDPDMFKAEKRRLKEQIKEDKKREREYEKEKQKVDVFSFINSQLSGSKNESEESDEVKTSKALASSSRKNLNVEKFRISEDIRRVERDVIKLKESLKRHQSGSPVFNHLSNKLFITENELNKLQASERSITREQNRRDSTKKLAVF